MPDAAIYIRLEKKKSPDLQLFLLERAPESELARSLLAQIRKEEEEIRGFKLSPCLALGIEEALDLDIMLKKAIPTAKGGWTPLHSVRMNLLESITAHFRHVSTEERDALLEHRADSGFADK